MPISYHFVDRIIWVMLVGQYSSEDMKHTASLILNDPALTEEMNLLLDARQSTVNPTLEEVKQRAAFLRSVGHDKVDKIAIVVSDSLRYGLSRMLSIFAQMEGLKIEAFMDIEQARCWLDPTYQPASSDD